MVLNAAFGQAVSVHSYSRQTVQAQRLDGNADSFTVRMFAQLTLPYTGVTLLTHARPRAVPTHHTQDHTGAVLNESDTTSPQHTNSCTSSLVSNRITHSTSQHLRLLAAYRATFIVAQHSASVHILGLPPCSLHLAHGSRHLMTAVRLGISSVVAV